MTKQQLLTWIDFDSEWGDPDWGRHWRALPGLCVDAEMKEKLLWWMSDRLNPLHDAECVYFSQSARNGTLGYDPHITIRFELDESKEYSAIEFSYVGVTRFVYLADSHVPRYQEGNSKNQISPLWQSVHGDVMVPAEGGFEHQVLLHDGALLVRSRDFNLSRIHR